MNESELFRILFDTYFDRVYCSTCLIAQNDLIARDATQEAFIVAHKHLDRLQDLDKIYTWLTVVASNQAKDMIKKHHKCIPVASIDEIDNIIASPTDIMEQKDKEIDIRQALKMIDVKYREIIVFKYYLGFTEQEIGETLELPAGTVKSRLSRARIILKDILEPDTESGVVL